MAMWLCWWSHNSSCVFAPAGIPREPRDSQLAKCVVSRTDTDRYCVCETLNPELQDLLDIVSMALVWDNRAQVRRWLDSHSADSSNHPPTSQETSGLHETGFLTSFYAKCVKGLRIISQQSSETDGVDHNSRRYLRQAYEKLLLLEDAFLTNKIESSLGNHEHLRKAIARSLHEIGKLLVRGTPSRLCVAIAC